MPRPIHILFAGGVTPGHLYPGLAIAAKVIERLPQAAITFVGRGRAQERHIVRAAGFGFANLPSHPAPQRALHAMRFVASNLAGYWAARWFLKEQHVSLVVGLGGPASAATLRAAVSRGVPIVMLEQNVVPSRVTHWLARSAATVCAGFPQTTRHLPSAVPLVVTGNPARPAFERLYLQRESRVGDCAPRQKRLIVIGGSGGARSLNESMPAALAYLRDELADWQIVHQSGEGQLQETTCRYRAAGIEALVVAYIDELAPIMFESDLVVCRSSGTTLAELALAGVPALLAPYPPAMDYQMPNAEVFSSAGAAAILDESAPAESLEDALVAAIKPLVIDDVGRARMSANMRRLARPDAAANITDAICRILNCAAAELAA
ncbi:MAG TPA: UDP-N-acetylglucosamine--N-acetylmuramyl-(pentapeptide) pyrophosphoryl-undecaprenol N-acetylglucosamine transferase [Lacipirellulaceae bacterium]|jgi:UDP-N-acetylglucosamine--N-acetylmuramyl-(pentapeptide) pyrophosphoryl-undecaprenol N-acetylglucosamine transferase|nr:UDP-N-acetylglucosamine--N-acetylmuramyl-(pentapeptide) pyrophosphoryl-undecaprenol N-acetylglucosamine transferase [Lacipirellulaceae bacterium]